MSTTAAARIAGLGEFTRARKQDNRRRLIEAAAEAFRRDGYALVSVDMIAREAGVSRQTFYRHFDGKFAIAMAFFEQEMTGAVELWEDIANRRYSELPVVENWIRELRKFYEQRRAGLRAIVEISMFEQAFMPAVRQILPSILANLAKSIPGFARAVGDDSDARRQWVEAWMLLYELLSHCHAVSGSDPEVDPDLLFEMLARRFHRFAQG